MRALLGGKGSMLAELTRHGLPVPPGFTLPTTAASHFADRPSPDALATVNAALASIADAAGRAFGDPAAPLLLAVRSGAPVSMPGMMDTVLNVGLTDATLDGLIAQHDSEAFALDCYCRLIAAYATAVAGVPRGPFDAAFRAAGLSHDVEATPGQLSDLLDAYKSLYADAAGEEFPQDPLKQLLGAIAAVYGSADGERARHYRASRGLADAGTAVNVQAMVFGNLDNDSGTGVFFTRDPRTGAPGLHGEFLVNAQGEDLVAGRLKPHDIATELVHWQPAVRDQLGAWRTRLEALFRDVQDVEFTVERGQSYLLQTRTAQRTAAAAVRAAVEMADEGLITRDEALHRVNPDTLGELIRPALAPPPGTTPLATGLPASPGIAIGLPAFTAAEAVARAAVGEAVILVRPETDTDDIAGIDAAAGVLTATGGMTSHAAVVARGSGRPCVVGVESMRLDEAARVVIFATDTGDRTFGPADALSLDADTGHVYAGRLPTSARVASPHLATLLTWADDVLGQSEPDDPAAKLRAVHQAMSSA